MTGGSLRIGFLMSGLGVVERGAEAFVLELATALAARPGFAVEVYCRGDVPLPYRRLRAVRRDQPFLVRLYGATRFGRKVADTLFLDPLSVEWYSASLAAFPHLWRQPVSLLVMEGGLLGARLARVLRRSRGVPWVDIAHGVDPKWEGAFARQGADAVVTFTAAAARQLQALAPTARIVTIPHGIDLAQFHPGAAPATIALPRPLVLAAGSLDEHKRFELTVAAVARLGGGSLVLLGEGPAAAAIDRAAAELLPGRYLRRAVPRTAMPGWYTASDCFTLPSRSESFGLTYLEAMACGRPVVAPDDAVRREVIGDGGEFCDVTDLDAYARALATALGRTGDPAPRRRAERFPIVATVDAYATLFSDLVAQRRVPR